MDTQAAIQRVTEILRVDPADAMATALRERAALAATLERAQLGDDASAAIEAEAWDYVFFLVCGAADGGDDEESPQEWLARADREAGNILKLGPNYRVGLEDSMHETEGLW